MNLEKIIIFLVISFFFCCAVYAQKDDSSDMKTVEFCYRCRVDSENPIWRFLFFLAASDYKEFFLREKIGRDGETDFREVIISNKDREFARFFSKNGSFCAKIDLDGETQAKELDYDRAKIWFEIQDFTRRAVPGDTYRRACKGPENIYTIAIDAIQITSIDTREEKASVIYFEGKVWKDSEEYLSGKIWVAQEGKFEGQAVKCSFKFSFFPVVVIEIM